MPNVRPPSRTDEVPESTVLVLAQTRPWVRLFGYGLIVGSAYMLASILLILSNRLPLAPTEHPEEELPRGMVLLLLPMVLLYVYPGVKLVGYSSAIKRLEGSRSRGDLESALLEQKAVWKFAGAAMMAFLAFMLLMVVLTVLLSAAKGVGRA